MLDLETKKSWVEGLRSDRFKQGRYCLKAKVGDDFQHCCLGVLMELKGYESVKHAHQTLPGKTIYSFVIKERVQVSGYPDPEMSRRIGLGSTIETQLSNMNDNQNRTFSEIADYIEKEL